MSGLNPTSHRRTDDIEGLSPLAVRLDGPEFDGGIVGTYEAEDGETCLVYGYWSLVKALRKAWKCTREEACDWLEYNTLRALPYMGPNRPMIIWEVK